MAKPPVIDMDASSTPRSRRIQPPRPTKYDTALEQLRQNFHAGVEQLAELVRSELVVPACRRLGMRFISGMGTFFFAKPGVPPSDPLHSIGADWEAKLAHRESLIPVLEVLNLEVEHGQCLGFWVADVDEADTVSAKPKPRRCKYAIRCSDAIKAGAKPKPKPRMPCPKCKGTGFLYGSCCPKCEGSMSIEVPAEPEPAK